ncbi:MAG: 23S rRNA (guanosine(2251)-2'-O)-methyltransferase RlmB [Lactobacillales bacterium]|jgi:23S rRNA (guanosine2251-2'-O)-methyltransferase|nr:23S rRNA (guanosine(2251)-2'-O)-methyltransferase RlmB [Lactobacillales bacterium]
MDNKDFVYGFYAVTEALEANRGNKLFVLETLRGEKVEKIKELAREFNVPVKWVDKAKLNLLSDDGVHQGFVLAVNPYAYSTLDEILEIVASKDQATILLLDEIEDPHNLGSILRTADASGVDGIIIPKNRAVGVTSVAAKTSTGASEYMKIARVTNIAQTIKKLKDVGFWVFGTDMNGTPYDKWNASGKVALIIGNEGRGMSPGLKKEVDELVTIPMVGHVQSLNASVAAGILMYEIFRKRS